MIINRMVAFGFFIVPALLIFMLSAVVSANELEGRVLDRIVGVVENNIILQSEITSQVEEYEYFYDASREELKCMIFGEMLQERLLLTGARDQGFEVDEDDVESELERRMNYFAMQVGGRQQLEDYYGQSIAELKNDLRDPLRRQMLVQQKKSALMRSIEVSPKEVRAFFNNIPEDSLPYYDTEVELAQIVIKPEITTRERERARERIRDIRSRILDDGNSFETMAILYSDDNASSSRGGELGFMEREVLDPEYAAMAFQLDEGEISPIVESQFGFHLIQTLERRGDRINTRHILIKPSITAEAEERAQHFADSIRKMIVHDTLEFHRAASLFSEDEQTKGSGGLMMDQETGSPRLSVDNLPARVFFAIDTLDAGQVTRPVSFRGQDGTNEFRIFKLIRKIPPHQANLDDDYPRIRQKALEQKENKVLNDWLKKRSEEVYLRIDPEFQQCREVTRFYSQDSP